MRQFEEVELIISNDKQSKGRLSSSFLNNNAWREADITEAGDDAKQLFPSDEPSENHHLNLSDEWYSLDVLLGKPVSVEFLPSSSDVVWDMEEEVMVAVRAARAFSH